MPARDLLAAWLGRAAGVLDVGAQHASVAPGASVGGCWRCVTQPPSDANGIGLCDACMSWCRCDDLLDGASSVATAATSSTTGR